jgi:acetolactate synthase-1/2/3 large subunit
MLQEFVDKTGIPFFNTQLGKGVIDETHPLYIGTAALSSGDAVHEAVDQADLILNVGHDVIEKPPFIMKRGGHTVIHLNFLSAQVDHIYFPQLSVIGDIANAVWQLKERITPQSHWDFAPFLKARETLFAHIAGHASSDAFPMNPARIVADTRATLPSDGILCLDNGMYKLWYTRGYQAHQPNTLLMDNALATMGAGLPSAIAAKMLYPDRKVIAVAGDGGFMMNSQEMETAVRLGLNITVLLLNDSGYGMIKWKQGGMNLPNFGLEFTNPDFVKYTESYGAHGYRVENPGHLKELLTHTLETPGVHLIEVPIDYSFNEFLTK